jgi:hypothetical protein
MTNKEVIEDWIFANTLKGVGIDHGQTINFCWVLQILNNKC